ncbi:hypothetical protein Brsp06_04622 [Brucella sp. NBRC 13694]|jgi:hypothetical protein|uniref:hypothetical protein n=1 Tax=Brucella/Ochrobactrum group TaxID=2826938 RepID=UPI002119E382|nr:hypothetical protein [Ochrobactrum sp. BTU2]MCQ9148376.1 hypothetical protein [Ochrobactrum sp. BTU2]MCR5943670.1 hypothetical protein [Ochrobactrum sp. XJ1]
MINASETSKTVVVFNCWQSDLSADTHRNAIREALRKAAKAIQNKSPEMKIVIDEALRCSSGAPNIAVNVREKIEKADIVVADITTITPTEAERPCPNPNVTFELGLGVAAVGWARTVMLFNGSPQKGEVPFDFAQHRVSNYSMTNKSDQVGRTALEKLVEKALRDIIEQDPKRPAQERGLSRHEIEHQRDVQMVRWLMEHLYVPAVSQTVSMLPKHILHRNLWFYEHFRGVATSTSFHLYDDRLSEAVESLLNAWGRAFSEDQAYTEMAGNEGYVFSSRMSGGNGSVGTARWDRIEAARCDMRLALDLILKRVRNDYLEIDIDETDKIAWARYQIEMAEIYS